jgi:hypothetical protein
MTGSKPAVAKAERSDRPLVNRGSGPKIFSCLLAGIGVSCTSYSFVLDVSSSVGLTRPKVSPDRFEVGVARIHCLHGSATRFQIFSKVGYLFENLRMLL